MQCLNKYLNFSLQTTYGYTYTACYDYSETNNGIIWFDCQQSKKMVVMLQKKVQIQILIDGESLERVAEYKYLGATIRNSHSWQQEINNCTEGIAKLMYHAMRSLLKKKKVSRETKVNVCKSM